MSLTERDDRSETLKALNRILSDSLKSLAEKGETERACTLAAEAWSLLRHVDPKEAERMNGLLHRFTRASKGESRGEEDGKDVRVDDYELDVRSLPPAARHERIFEAYHQLQPGQGFILVNDHDPKPLYYQFAFEYHNAFTWSPLESGPEVWRVRIGRP